MTALERDNAGRHKNPRIARGAAAFVSGMMAEDAVAARYRQQGHEVLARRWRGRGGEVDLIVRDDRDIVFVEVKKAATTELAAWRLGRRQMDRICLSAAEYCDRFRAGSLTPMRFDVALVDDFGRVEIIPNAFGVN